MRLISLRMFRTYYLQQICDKVLPSTATAFLSLQKVWESAGSLTAEHKDIGKDKCQEITKASPVKYSAGSSVALYQFPAPDIQLTVILKLMELKIAKSFLEKDYGDTRWVWQAGIFFPYLEVTLFCCILSQVGFTMKSITWTSIWNNLIINQILCPPKSAMSVLTDSGSPESQSKIFHTICYLIFITGDVRGWA